MAPTKKAAEPTAPPSPASDATQPRPSLTDVGFIQQLLQLAQQAAQAARGETVTLAEEDASGGNATSPQSSHPTSARGASSHASTAAAVDGRVSSTQTGLPADPSVQLYALLARALHFDEDYWTNLCGQHDVDEMVTFMHFCASQGYSPLKTHHLLTWLRTYRALVEGRREADDTVPEYLLPELNADRLETRANPTDSATSRRHQRRASATSSTASSTANRRTSAEARAHRKSSAASADKRSADMAARSLAAVVADEDPAAASAPAVELRVPYEEALRQGLSAFLANEVEMGWRWEQVPRNPSAAGGGNGALSSSGVGGAPSSSSGKKKASRSERARQQQLQQQELEEEQRRLAAAAALPPENIYLQQSEARAFVEPFVRRGLLQHAALYEYVAAHATQAEPRSGPQCVTLVLEPPVVPPPLDSVVAFTSGDLRGTGPSDDGARPAGGAHAAHKAVTSGRGSSTNLSPRGNNAAPTGGSTGRGKEDRHAGAAEAAQPTAAPAPAAAPVAPIEALRSVRAEELETMTRRHAEAVAAALQRAKTAETQKAMELTFADRAGTTKAACDVYESLEREVRQRQMRILQRITALEISLGLRPDPRQEGEQQPQPSTADARGRAVSAQQKTAAKQK